MNTATKFRNRLKKDYGARLIRSMGMSNPYADYQTLDAEVPVGNVNRLAEDLKAEGFVDASEYLSEKGKKTLIALRKGELGIQVSKKDGWTHVTGPKKAKKSDLPIYD